MLKLIDFDHRFSHYLSDWMEKNRENYATADDMEQDAPRVYEEFLDTPADWLDGEKPGEYFEKYSDANLLVSWAKAYVEEGIELPDMLLNRISELGSKAEAPLTALLNAPYSDKEKRLVLRMLAVTLLREIESTRPMDTYIKWILDGEQEEELLENALESLDEMGDKPRGKMLSLLSRADDRAKEAFLSLLSRCPGNPAVCDELVRLFNLYPEKRAVLSAYLGRLGDERALPVLMEAALDESTSYLDFIEIRNAIEELGGDAPEREFDEDETYARLFSDD